MILSSSLLLAIGAGALLLGVGIFLASIQWGIAYSGAIAITGAVLKYRLSR